MNQKQPPSPSARLVALTPRLRRALSAIHRHIEEHGHGPTARELAERMDQTPASAKIQMRDLIAAGMIARTRAWHAIEVTKKGRKALEQV